MLCFPPELSLSIFEFATWDRNTHDPDPLDMSFQLFITKDNQSNLRRLLRTRLALTLVCKEWNAIATPLLYQNIVIGRGRQLPNISTILEVSHQTTDGFFSVGRWTKRLDIALRDSSRPVDEELAIIADIVRCLPNLEIVTFSVASPQYSDDDTSPCLVLRALEFTCASSLKYIHWFRDTLVPNPESLATLFRNSPNLRSFNTPLVPAAEDCDSYHDGFFHSSLTTIHAEARILDYASPIPPHLMNLPSLRQMSFVVPLFAADARWRSFLEWHGSRLQHIQALIYLAGNHFQSDLAYIASSCRNLLRLDLAFSHWTHMPFPVTLPPTVEHLGIFCTQGQIANYQTFFSRLDRIEYGAKLRCIQFLGKRNVRDIFDKHLHQFWSGTRRLRGSGVRFMNHRGACIA